MVALAGLDESLHTAVVRATVPGTGAPVPVVPEVDEAEAATAPEPSPPAEASPATGVADAAEAAQAAETTEAAVAAEPSGPVAPVGATLPAERTGSGDGEVLVVLDAAALPDDDPRVVVEVTVAGVASPAVELVLPGCAPTPTGTPPAAPATGLTGQPAADEAAPAPTAPSAGASTPTTTPALASLLSTAAPTVPPVQTPPAATPTSSRLPSVPEVLEQASTPSAVGTGTSGQVSLRSFTAAPQLDAAPAPLPVPAPLIAAPEGSAAGVLPAAPETPAPLDRLLPPTPQDLGEAPVTTSLAAPDLATDAAADPLVDLAPAVFVLSASLGGLLVAGRRRTT